jgi:succinoglycan biosynthesis protein ExoV
MVKLHYYQFENGTPNFGDDLNQWLWSKLLPDVLDDDDAVTLIGIGTLLNNALSARTPKALTRLIFSTGVGYERKPLQLDESYKVYCVRGPLSAKALGLEESVGITDGALLIRTLQEHLPVKDSSQPHYRYAYMPHVQNAGEFWKVICESLNLRYIDPTQPVTTIFQEILNTDVLLTEAMHGAIVADSFRVPWVPIATTRKILAFKWQDWCASIGLTYNPYRINLLLKYKKLDKLFLTRAARHQGNQIAASYQLREISRRARPVLSKASKIEELTSRLQEKLVILNQDIDSYYS